MIPLSFEVFTTWPDFVSRSIFLQFDSFIISLFLELLSMVEILLANNSQFLELGG